MLTLAVDTSTSAIGAAVVGQVQGREVRSVAVRVDVRGHAEHLAPLVRDALRDAGAEVGDLSMVAVGTGPGPFTGLRVGIVTGLTVAHALGLPVYGVCSLDTLAHQAASAGVVGDLLVATDARRKEVYWARYRAAGPQSVTRLSDPTVDRPTELPQQVRALPVVGRGPALFPEAFDGEPVDGVLDVDPGTLADVAAARVAAGEPMPVEPLYLRRPDALTTAERAAR